MIRFLIIADDFTGALDTGVQLVAYGVAPRVITNTAVDFEVLKDETEALVIDAETRHLSAGEAYIVIEQIVKRAVKMGISCLYKKTDSALRGNIGAELTAFMKAAEENSLAFIPALPEMKRCTVSGIHYIDGVPVAESIFGKEPFEPVKHSEVAEIIHEQSSVPTYHASAESGDMPRQGIYIFDASSQEDLEVIGNELAKHNKLHIAAGCAGFGSVLPPILGWKKESHVELPCLDTKLLVICGSVNPITQKQMDVAEKNGFYRYRLTPEQKLDALKWEQKGNDELIEFLRHKLAQNPYMIIDSNDSANNELSKKYAEEHDMSIDDMRITISGTIGRIVSELFNSPDMGTLLITGGDILKQCMDWMKVYEMEPVGEMVSGVVLSKFTKDGCTRYVFSKSGGFGEETLVNDLVKFILQLNNR